MELCQGDNTPSPEQTNQEHTSRGRQQIFNKVENPHHAASPKWPRQNCRHKILTMRNFQHCRFSIKITNISILRVDYRTHHPYSS